MKFLIIGDIHGQAPRFHFKEYDAIIAPGDFCSSDKIRKIIFRLFKNHDKGKDLGKVWYDVTGKRKAKTMIDESIKAGQKVLKQLTKKEVPVFGVPGNTDHTGESGVTWHRGKSEWKILDRNLYKERLAIIKNYNDVYLKKRIFKDFAIIGWGSSSCPEIPIASRHKGYRQMKKVYNRWFNKLDKLFKEAKRQKKTIIFISHNVPYNTKLDKIRWKESPAYGEHYGSILARQLIERHQPAVCIGGHIHENHGKTKIKNTLCINAGHGGKANTLLEINGKRITTKFYH